MFLRYNLWGILWAIFILVLSGLPSSEFPAEPPFKYFDKTIHFFLYTQLSLLLIVGFKKQFEIRGLKKHPVKYTFILSVIYGVLTELLQNYVFKDRTIELADILANISGTIFGILVFFIIYGKPSN